MRLWSIHPKYLDAKGLVALWRESLLAKAVLHEQTVGYRNHPQLIRFKDHQEPTIAINAYLISIFEESKHRGYRFDEGKIDASQQADIGIDVTKGQLEYEYQFLCEKVKVRDPLVWDKIRKINKIEANPIFKVVDGSIQSWEKVRGM